MTEEIEMQRGRRQPDSHRGLGESDDSDPGTLAVRRAIDNAGLAGTIALELAGGASTRRFFRLRLPQGRTLVAMYVPDPSQEIQKARQVVGGYAFVEIRQLLSDNGIRVPNLVSHQPEHRVLLVEDLGDSTLAEYLAMWPEAREVLYRQAIAVLARARTELSSLPTGSVVAQRAFDTDLLRWEVDHFRDWALEARGIHLTAAQQRVFDNATNYLATTIATWPRGFVHRDYQSRNLMVRQQDGSLTLTWIDFQDAMLGPRAYDLVALLMDSYQTFERSFVISRLEEYAQATRDEGDLDELVREFDLITVQRKLKDAGRFVFVAENNGNDGFLRYVESTIFRARSALGRVAGEAPELAALGGLLDDVLGPLPESEPEVDSENAADRRVEP